MLAVLGTAQFIDILDVTIVNIALPHISRDLQFRRASVQWVITAYTLLYGGFLLLGGRLADLFGRRRMFLTGLALFGSASLAAGLAPDAAALVGSARCGARWGDDRPGRAFAAHPSPSPRAGIAT